MEKGEELPPRTIEWNIRKIMADSCWVAGYTGDSIYLGILGTGVDFTHPALEGNFGGWWLDVVNNLPNPYDDHGHGTHVAGIICGGDGLGPFVYDIGVAPNALLIAGKVFNAGGTGIVFDIHAGMQWLAVLKADTGVDIRAVNNSWGSSSTTTLEFWDDCLTWLSLNIIPVFSIGNNGPGSGLAGTPGNFSLVVGVGATDSYDSMQVYSSRGSAPDSIPWNNPNNWFRPDWNLIKPDITAPGAGILSCVPNNRYTNMSGTSMSAPHVTGAAAILCERNLNLTPHDLYNILVMHTDEPPQGAPYPNNNYGWGRLNVWQALRAVIGVEEQKKKEVKNNIVLPTIVRGPLYLPSNRKLTVFDISGREVAPPYLAPGVYFVELDKKIIRKVVIVK